MAPALSEPSPLILVVDDDRLVQELISRTLRAAGLSVTLAADGAQAVSLVRRTRPDLIISDVNMPNLDGHDLLRSLRDQPDTAGIPVILMSSTCSAEDIVTGFDLGADDFIAKPVSPTELVARVRAKLTRVPVPVTVLSHLTDQATHDDLTGLLNRSRFHEELDRLVARSKRGAIGALILLDLDHFKAINDRQGHAAGDATLVRVADALQSQLREVDYAARVGGDEFAVLLPDTDASGAEVCVRRMLEAIRELASLRVNDGKHISASAGLALLPEHADSAGQLYERSDLALYRAKRRRDCYCLFSFDIDGEQSMGSPSRQAG